MRKFLSMFLALLLLAGSLSASAELQVQQFPASSQLYAMMDPEDPYRTVVSGLFQQTTQVGEAERPFYVYFASNNHQMEANVTLIPPFRQIKSREPWMTSFFAIWTACVQRREMKPTRWLAKRRRNTSSGCWMTFKSINQRLSVKWRS